MPLTGVDDQHLVTPRDLQQGPTRAHRGAQARDVVPQRLAEASRFEEVSLHVDHDDRGASHVDRQRSRLSVHDHVLHWHVLLTQGETNQVKVSLAFLAVAIEVKN